MCNSASAELVREIVNDLVNKNIMFTAWDVSRKVQDMARERGIPTERHRDLKGTTHGEMANFVSQGIYEKTLHNVGAPTEAFVYHPTGTDVATYVPQLRNDPVATATTPSLNVRKTDARGTLAIPKHMTEKAGLVPPCGVAYAVARTNSSGKPELVVGKQALAGHGVVATYTVDDYGNVRVTQHALGQAGIGGSSNYVIEMSGDDWICISLP